MGYFNYVFENNSLKGLFGENKKKLKILKLSRDSRYLQKLALKTFREKKNQNKGWFRSGSLVNIILYTYKGRMIQFKYKYLKINGDVNITGNRRALAEGKEASISFDSESKCFFFHHGDIPQNFEFGLGSTGSVSRFLRLLFKLTSF